MGDKLNRPIIVLHLTKSIMKVSTQVFKNIAFAILFMSIISNSFSQRFLANREWAVSLATTDTIQNFYKKVTIKTDIFNNVYLLGATIGVNGYDWYLMKTTSASDTVFITQFNGDGNNDDIPYDMFIDPLCNIYVVGRSAQNNTDSADACIAKFDSTGNELWHAYPSGTHAYNDSYVSICPDTSGYMLVCGAMGSVSTGYDYLLSRFHPGGTEDYSIIYDYVNLDDVAVKVLYDPLHDFVTIVGASQPNDTTWDYYTRVYDASSGVFDKDLRNLGGYGPINKPADAVIYNGNYYITGSVATPAGYDIKTIALDDSLHVLGERTYDGPDHMDDHANSIKIDSTGNVYITGKVGMSNYSTNMVTIKYDNTGNEDWVNFYDGSDGTLNDGGSDIELHNDNVYVTGFTNGTYYNTICYDTSGNTRWQKTSISGYATSSHSDMAIDNQGDIIIAAPLVYGGMPASIHAYYAEKYRILEVSNEVISDTSDVPICKKNEMIVKFNPDVIKTNIIDDRDKVFGSLTDFIQDSTIYKMSHKLSNDLKSMHAIKIFKRFTTADSLSITRLGDTIKIEEIWSTLLITVPDTVDLAEWMDSLRTINNDIFYVEPDILTQLAATPNDSYYNDQYNLYDPIDPDADINIEPAWDYEAGTANIKVGVYDTGIDWEHEDFSRDGSGDFTESIAHKGYDYLFDQSLTSSSYNFDYLTGHGTFVAGIIAARRNNFIGVAGIAGGDGSSVSGVELYNLRLNLNSSFFSDNFSSSSISNAVYEGGSNIINGTEMSLALNIANHSYFWKTSDPHFENTTMKKAFYYSWRNGVTHCVCRGNAEEFENPSQIAFPACYNDLWMITVGAAGDNGQVLTPSNSTPSFFSMTGSDELDCIAPGSEAVVKKTTEPVYHGYGPFSGTSAATPHVSGVAALIQSYYNDLNNSTNFQNLVQDDIEHLIEAYASDRDIPGFDQNTGYGMLDADAIFQNIHQPYYDIIHVDGLNPDATSSSVELANETLVIPHYIAGMVPGTYLVDKYVVTHTFNYTLPSGYSYKDSWILKSHAIGFQSVSNNETIDGNFWGESEIISSNSTQTIVRTRCYSITTRITPTFEYYSGVWLANTPPGTVKIPFAIHIENPTANTVENSDINIRVFPNPTSSFIKIQGEKIIDLEYKLVNMQGVLLKNGFFNSTQFVIDIEELPPSLYILQIQNNENYHKSFSIIKL
jgi:subtilisin family serine protease